jgi:hypothetical protein
MTVEARDIIQRGPRYKVFIPCLEERCPEHMQLIDTDTKPKYKCMRRPGYKGRMGVVYTEPCYFHDNPRDAIEVSWWARSPDAPKRPHGVRDAPTKEDWETAI